MQKAAPGTLSEITKEQQKNLINQISEDRTGDVLNEIKTYIIYDKDTFYRLQKEFLNNDGGVRLADLKDKLKLFISCMNELPESEKKGLLKVSEKIISPTTTAVLGAISILTGLFLGIWGELIPPEIYDTLKNAFGDYYVYVWLCVGILLFAISVFSTISKKNEKARYLKKQKDQERIQRLKFIEKLETRYNLRLEQKLGDRLPIPLEFEIINEEINDEHFITFEILQTIKEEQEKLSDISQKYPYMLILGKPGSGKTSRLLDLAKGLLVKAKNIPTAGVPTIFNLAAWNENYPDFEAWLAKMLVDLYGYPKELAHIAIAENMIIPLLDGLDEVGLILKTENERNQLRSKCLDSIASYKKRRYAPEQFVICSRIDEYKSAGGDARVNLKIIVKDVSPETVMQTLINAEKGQSERYKGENADAAYNLLELIGREPENPKNALLKTVLQTPFYYNASMLTFHMRSDKDLKLPNHEEQLKQFIVKEFVERKIADHSNTYGINKTHTYLKWLAMWLKNQQNVSFELSHFQPFHLENPKKFSRILLFIHALLGSIVGGIGGFIGAGFFKFTFEGLGGSLIDRLGSYQGGFILGSIYGLCCFIFLGSIITSKREIVTSEISKWKLAKLKSIQNWMDMLVVASILALFYLLIFIIIYGVKEIGENIIVLVVAVFSTALIIIIKDDENFTVIEKPYTRLWGDIVQDTITIALMSIIYGFIPLYFYYEKDLLLSLIVPALYTLANTCLQIINSPVFWHFVLTFLLQNENKAPIRMDKFYNYCADLHILEKDGGTWRFRHQIIHDYFITSAANENLKSDETATFTEQ